MTDRKLTTQQQKFLDVLFEEANADFRTAMRIAGYADSTTQTIVMRSLKAEIIEATELYLAEKGPKAAVSVAGVMENPVELGNKEKLAAATQILDRIGIVKVDKVDLSGSEIKGALFFMPAKDAIENETS